MRIRRLALVLGLAAASVVLAAGPAAAHPLGNFTTNRFSGLEFTPDGVEIHYVVDMAEIPTFQVLSSVDRTGREDPAPAGLQRYADALAPRLLRGVGLTADGTNVALRVAGDSARLRPGQGGLKILRIETTFRGPLTSSEASISYRDSNYSDRIGWKEVIAYASSGQGLSSASVPERSVSDALLSYPKAMLSSPLDVTSASVHLKPGAPGGTASQSAPGTHGLTSPGQVTGPLGTTFTSLIGHHLSPLFLGLALLLAVAAGALHALGPGHGKSIMAAYLVGTEGRVRHAMIVGVAVSLMHTASVVALGLVVLGASRLFAPETVFPWLSLISGVVVLSLGAWLFRARLGYHRSIVGSPVVEHRHGHSHSSEGAHEHGHADSHGDGHSHSHAVLSPNVELTSWRGLGVIAISGGLLPSPSALVVLLGAVALHRIAFGMILVGAFSVGLASALTIVGVLVIKARSFAARRFGERATSLLPVLSAAAILILGVFLTAGAVTKL